MTRTYLTAALAVFVGTSASAVSLFQDFQFNTAGDLEGWETFQADGTTADGDSLNYTPNANDSQIRLGLANGPSILTIPTGAEIDSVVVRYRRTLNVGTPEEVFADTHSNNGTIVQLFRPAPPNNNVTNIAGGALTSVDDGDGFFLVTADFNPDTGADYPWEADGIGRIRIDMVGGAGSVGDLIEIDSVQVFIEQTLVPGDADGDGDVDDTDLGIAISNFTGPGATGKTLAEGDTDGDGDVDDTDLGVAISGFTGPLAAVPEPTSLALLGLGGLLVARRRRA